MMLHYNNGGEKKSLGGTFPIDKYNQIRQGHARLTRQTDFPSELSTY